MKKNLFYVFLVIFIVVLAFTISIVNKNYIVGAKAYTKAKSNVSIVKNDTIDKKPTKEKGVKETYEDILATYII